MSSLRRPSISHRAAGAALASLVALAAPAAWAGPPAAAAEDGTRRPAPARTAPDAEAARGLHFTFDSASAPRGLSGRLEDAQANFIRFEARASGGSLRAVITTAAGEPLAEYVEGGSALPQLRVLGVPYEDMEVRSEAALASLARRAEGPLVRELARRLVAAVPAADLARERRGLAVPYQAAQHHFPAEQGGGFRETEDYLEGAGGFVVKGLDRRLIMRRNYSPPSRDEVEWVRFQAAQRGARSFHDPSQVGDCFGTCGGGCGSWQDQVIELTHVVSETWHPPGTWGVCPVSGGWDREYTGNCEHKSCGCRTHGCATHDWCVRELCGGDAFNACSWTFCNVPNPNPTSWTIIWAGVSSVTCLWRGDTCWIHYGPCSHTFRSTSCYDPCCEAAVTREEQMACGGCNY
jgi:hypothetical protein